MHDWTFQKAVEIEGAECLICGVIDGHGEAGEVVAEFVAQLLPQLLQQHISQTPSRLHAAIQQAFLAVDKALYKVEDRQGHGVCGGAAVVAAILWRGRCMVAHCH